MPAAKPVAVAAVPPLGDQLYVYVPVPPVTVAVALPVEAPWQATFVCVGVKLNAVGSVMVYDWLIWQLLASVTVTVYVPAARPLDVAAVPPLGDQLYVYALVPPVTVAVAEPFIPLLQLTLVCVGVIASAAGSVMVKLCVVWQVLPSVMVTV